MHASTRPRTRGKSIRTPNDELPPGVWYVAIGSPSAVYCGARNVYADKIRQVWSELSKPADTARERDSVLLKLWNQLLISTHYISRWNARESLFNEWGSRVIWALIWIMIYKTCLHYHRWWGYQRAEEAVSATCTYRQFQIVWPPVCSVSFPVEIAAAGWYEVASAQLHHCCSCVCNHY
jgi:hypothetical protein